jgi:hypothetical protein
MRPNNYLVNELHQTQRPRNLQQQDRIPQRLRLHQPGSNSLLLSRRRIVIIRKPANEAIELEAVAESSGADKEINKGLHNRNDNERDSGCSQEQRQPQR